MTKVVRSPLAENDLLNIWQYSYEKWGANKAGEYLLQLNSGMQELANNPLLGKSREIVRPSYRSIQINRHVIYYKVQNDVIDIIRVLHERMIPEKHL